MSWEKFILSVSCGFLTDLVMRKLATDFWGPANYCYAPFIERIVAVCLWSLPYLGTIGADDVRKATVSFFLYLLRALGLLTGFSIVFKLLIQVWTYVVNQK